MKITEKYATESGYPISQKTLDKLEKGYRSAKYVLSEYAPKNKTLFPDPDDEKEVKSVSFDYVAGNDFKFYTQRQLNKMISANLVTVKKSIKNSYIQFGEVRKPNGIPAARLFTDTKTGNIIVVFTGL